MAIYMMFPGSYTKGIYYNASRGLITYSKDGSNRITMADKNLGATTVYVDNSTLTAANCGNFYQWGNNYGFPRTGATSKEADTTKDTTGYGPGNYYSNSTFLYTTGSSQTWLTSANENLWGGVTGTVAAMRGPCASGYHIPTINEFKETQEILYYFGLVSPVATSGSPGGTGYKTYLKMPYAGEIYFNGTVDEVNSRGRYWSSEVAHTWYRSKMLCFQSNWVTTLDNGNNERIGACIRPFFNESVIPDNTRTVLYQ